MEKTDVLIIGSGIAGLSLAIKLNTISPDLSIAIVTKADASEGNTRYAQGGIAAVMDGQNASYEDHVNDTLSCGKGLCDKKIVEMVVRQAPERIKELAQLGVQFDKDTQSDFQLALEGGHSVPRIVHHKDKTGSEVESVLIQQIKNRKNITVFDNHAVVDLLIANQNGSVKCTGVQFYEPSTNKISSLNAAVTVIASGGCGQVYLNTTNPVVATGDGYAIAKRAGATIKNMRFMQFHPTSLYQGNDGGVSFLLSEALRGFGAHIVDEKENRFLFSFDKRGELATRDIVSAAIFKHMKAIGSECVYLDLRHIDTVALENHFPQITKELHKRGYDYTRDLIPIVPSAHYQCGGIVVNENAQTNIADLYAIGEVACTGLHGANRLASNSLLEALVFAHNAALKIASTIDSARSPQQATPAEPIAVKECNNKQINSLALKVKKLMSSNAFQSDNNSYAGVEKELVLISQTVDKEITENHFSVELLNLRNIAQTAQLIVKDIIESAHDEHKQDIHLEESNSNI
jgi:L-aspartate oxidase